MRLAYSWRSASSSRFSWESSSAAADGRRRGLRDLGGDRGAAGPPETTAGQDEGRHGTRPSTHVSPRTRNRTPIAGRVRASRRERRRGSGRNELRAGSGDAAGRATGRPAARRPRARAAARGRRGPRRRRLSAARTPPSRRRASRAGGGTRCSASRRRTRRPCGRATPRAARGQAEQHERGDDGPSREH